MTIARELKSSRVGIEEIQHFLNEQVCRSWLLGKLHPQGPACPSCGAKLTSPKQVERFQSMETVRCQECGRSFNGLSGTAFHRVQLSPVEIVAMLMLMHFGRSTLEIARQLSVDERTARRWRRRFAGHFYLGH